MATFDRITVFEDGDHAVIFDGQDMTLRVLPLPVYQALGLAGLESVPDGAEASPRAEKVASSQGVPGEERPANARLAGDHRPALHRLTLNISNDCNMACKYCYANGGSYYTPGMLMDQNTALRAINFVLHRFSAIEHVNFFGGEPTLNLPIVRLVCEYLIYLHERGVLARLPSFGLTTNGYSLNAHLLQLLKAYRFSLTVSLDGPKEIHDRLRRSRDGSPTYDVVAANVQAILRAGIVPEIECTYTAEHWRSGIDLIALMDFFYNTFHCRTLHCPMVTADPQSRWFVPLDVARLLFTKAVRYSMQNLAHGIPCSISMATRFLDSLSTRTPVCHYCPAGTSTLTVNTDGNIYACFMLMNGTDLRLGSIYEESADLALPHKLACLQSADKEQNSACQACWARSLCFGCLGEDVAREGFEIRRSSVPGQSALCDLKRELVQVFLRSAAAASLESGGIPQPADPDAHK